MIAQADRVLPEVALAFLLEQNGLSQTQIASEPGIDQVNLSAFLNGKRGLSKTNAAKLASRFKVSANLFLPQA